MEIKKWDQVTWILRSSNKCKADFDKSLNYCLLFLENFMLAFSQGSTSTASNMYFLWRNNKSCFFL